MGALEELVTICAQRKDVLFTMEHGHIVIKIDLCTSHSRGVSSNLLEWDDDVKIKALIYKLTQGEYKS